MARIAVGIDLPGKEREIIEREHGRVCLGNWRRVWGGEPHLRVQEIEAHVAVHEAHHVAAVALVPTTH